MPLFCPTDQQVALSAAALRPRGDAWRHGGFDALEGSTMGQFFGGLGRAAGPTHRRLCDMVDEFFCSTASETADLWQLEYGLPDACGPFLSACEKANAVGDSTALYAIGVAAARGWSIAIAEQWITNVEDCACGLGLAGTMIAGAENGVAWEVTVDLDASPSYVPSGLSPPLMGLLLPGDQLNCDEELSTIRCILRLIAPAHADLVLRTKPPSPAPSPSLSFEDGRNSQYLPML